MLNKLKENKLILIIFIIGIILIVTGVTYSLYNILFVGKKEQTVVVGNINFTYNEKTNGLSLNNDDILDNTSGINQEKYFDFDISLNSSNNISITYQIAIEEDKTNTLTNDKIKLYLTDQNNNKIKDPVNISDLKLDNKGYRKLYINTINQNETQKYRLRAWVDVDKAYEITNNGGTHSIKLNSASYKFKVNVYDTELLDKSGANEPILASNMIPVYYDEANSVWKKADVSNTDKTNPWYSYNSSGEYKGRWANAVTVKDTNRQTYLNATPGTTIPMDDITTMWVWIPRFKVNTTDFDAISGEGSCLETSITTKEECVGRGIPWLFSNPGAIDVSFVKQNETAIDAFTFGTKELSGFWYGKFEISHTTLSSETNNNLGCTNETCSNANGIIIKPNVRSLKRNNVSNLFFASRSMEQPNNSFGFVSSEVDTHMSKNNEWGAVAYLTQSIYGRCTNSTTCTEVGINNNTYNLTGYGAPAGSDDSVTNGTYNTTLGKDASTTKNIYGIYDMSGREWEYVMGVLADPNGKPRSGKYSLYSSGFTGMLGDGTTYTGITFPDSKYYNLYTGDSYPGHALTETAGWYSDNASFVNTSNPWFIRGGYWYDKADAGVFYFNYSDGGDVDYDYSSRLVISNE